MSTKPLKAKSIDVDSIPTTGHVVRIEAGPEERTAIAEAYGLVEVRSFVADLEARRAADRSLVVDGRVRAEIVQNCVVSLEPVMQSINEAIQVRFVPADAPNAPAPPRPGAEIHVDPDAEPPEILADGRFDPGDVALEHFALAIDPYPRAPGAELPDEVTGSAGAERESPFAVLAKLAGTD
jgi:uncharacterized metal-binding protein YceD (DUF177 family)